MYYLLQLINEKIKYRKIKSLHQHYLGLGWDSNSVLPNSKLVHVFLLGWSSKNRKEQRKVRVIKIKKKKS